MLEITFLGQQRSIVCSMKCEAALVDMLSLLLTSQSLHFP